MSVSHETSLVRVTSRPDLRRLQTLMPLSAGWSITFSRFDLTHDGPEERTPDGSDKTVSAGTRRIGWAQA